MIFHDDTWSIYIVEAKNGMIKIGISRTPHSRAAVITQCSPVPARLVATWRAPWRDEGVLHKRFLKHRTHNEWFRCEGELATYVHLMSGVGLSAPIVDWSEVDGSTREQRAKQRGIKASTSLKNKWAEPGYKEKQVAWRKRLQDRSKECQNEAMK